MITHFKYDMLKISNKEEKIAFSVLQYDKKKEKEWL
jgi:hypothetical protein